MKNTNTNTKTLFKSKDDSITVYRDETTSEIIIDASDGAYYFELDLTKDEMIALATTILENIKD